MTKHLLATFLLFGFLSFAGLTYVAIAQIVSQSTAQVNGEGTSDAGTICVSNSTLDVLGQQACDGAKQDARTKCERTCEKQCGLETPSAECDTTIFNENSRTAGQCSQTSASQFIRWISGGRLGVPRFTKPCTISGKCQYFCKASPATQASQPQRNATSVLEISGDELIALQENRINLSLTNDRKNNHGVVDVRVFDDENNLIAKGSTKATIGLSETGLNITGLKDLMRETARILLLTTFQSPVSAVVNPAISCDAGGVKTTIPCACCAGSSQNWKCSENPYPDPNNRESQTWAEGTCFQEVCYGYPVEVEGDCPLLEEQVRLCRAAEDASLKIQVECLNPRLDELGNKIRDCIERAKQDCIKVGGAFTTGENMRPPIRWRRP